MARIVLIDQSDYRLIVKEDGTITFDTGIEGTTHVIGKLLVGADSEFEKNLVIQEDLTVNGGDISSTATEFNIFEENVNTITFGLVATDISIGSNDGITTINHDLAVNG